MKNEFTNFVFAKVDPARNNFPELSSILRNRRYSNKYDNILKGDRHTVTLDMSATASDSEKHFYLACYSLPRVHSYILLVLSSPIEIEVTTSIRADWELPNLAVD